MAAIASVGTLNGPGCAMVAIAPSHRHARSWGARFGQEVATQIGMRGVCSVGGRNWAAATE